MTFDLLDAYFHIPISPDHKWFLRFAFQWRALEYNILLFGLSLSPRTVMTCIVAGLIPLQQRGIQVFNYLDDRLVCVPSKNLARSHTEAVQCRWCSEIGLWFKGLSILCNIFLQGFILYSLCPVRALRFYLDLKNSLCTSDKLLVTYGGATLSRPISKQHQVHWIVDPNALAYVQMGADLPFQGLWGTL